MAVTAVVERAEVTEVLDALPRHDLVVTPHPLTDTGRVVLRGVMLARGDTLASLLARHGVLVDQPGWVVRVGGMDVPAALWARTRAKPGMLIEAHRVAGKSVLRLVAMVALTYFTMGLAAPAAGMAGGLAGALGMSTGFAAYAVNAGALMLGSMVINKVLPPPGPGSYGGTNPGTTYSLQGARNAARHFQPLGLLMGQVRVAPDFAAQPYSWFEGDDQYQYVQLHAGLNVHTVDELKIGATDIASYSGVTVTRSGFASGNGTLLQWESVDTIAGGLLDAVTAPGAYVERNSSPNTVRLQVDLVGQLQYINSSGNPQRFTVDVGIEYRLLPAGPWLPFQGATATVQLANSTTKPLRRTLTRTVAAGQYAVRMRKLTKNETRTQAANVIEWAALKSYQADTGTAVARQVVGITIKASGQLNGTLDQVTWLATSTPCPVWNGSAWVTQTTSNPGALYLQFCRGHFDGTGRLLWGIGKPDDQIDIEGLKAWMLHCAAEGYRFDHWWDAAVSRADVLDAIAAAGLAARSYHTGKLGVVYMASGQPIEAVIGMGNIKRGTMRVDYATRVTAEEIEVSTPERTNAWLPASLRVLAPGVTTPRETARLSPPGITTEAGRLRTARAAMAQNIYGRKSVSWEMDLEHLTFRRWSLVALSHDLTQWGYSGRLHVAALNVAVWSEDLTNAAWSKSSSTVVLSSAVPPPDVAALVSLLTVSGVSTGVFQTYTVMPGQVWTFSFLARRSASAAAAYRVWCNTTSMNIVSPTSYYGQISSTDWAVVSVTFTVPAGCTSIRCYACAEPGGAYVTAVAMQLGAVRGPYALTQGAGPRVGLELDAEVPSGSTPHIGLRLPGEQAYRVFSVATFSGTVHALMLADAWPAGVPLPGSAADNPADDTVWIFDFTAQPGLRLRVADIRPTANLSGARITAVPEPDAFWAYMASGAYTVPATPAGPAPVVLSNLQVTQQRLTLSYDLTAELDITFDALGPYDHAQVWGAVGDDALQLLGSTRTTRFSGWRVVNPGEVTVRVQAFDALGRPGAVLLDAFPITLDSPLAIQGNLLPVDELTLGLSVGTDAAPQFLVGQWELNRIAAAPAGPTNAIVLDTGPDGQPALMWRTTSGTAGDNQGGFNRWPGDLVDASRPYRFAVWMRCSGDTSGNYYLGCGSVREIGSVVEFPNPYFMYAARATLVPGRWYLLAGYVLPWSYSGAVTTQSGVWDSQTGEKVLAGTDFQWLDANTSTCRWRAYQFYTTAAGAVQDWALPMVHLLDGTEPSIAALLAMSARGRVAWVTASSQVFGISKAGAVTPTTITLTALAQNLAGAPVFDVVEGTATLGGSGTTRTLAYADMATDSVRIRMTWAGIQDSITIVKVREGVDGTPSVSSSLSRLVANFTADSTGAVDAGQTFATTMKVMLGTTDDTANWTISRSSSDASITTTISGATVTVTGIGTAVESGTVTVQATRFSYPTQTIVMQVGKVKRATPSAYPQAFGLNVSADSYTASAATTDVRLNNDGTIDQRINGGSWTGAGNWFAPTTAGIGSSYRVFSSAVTQTQSGSADTTSSLSDSPASLASGVQFTLSASAGVGAFQLKTQTRTINICSNSDLAPLATGTARLICYADRT